MILTTAEHEQQAAKAPPLRPPVSRIAIWAPLVAVLLLGLGLVYGIWHHIQQKREQEEFAKQTSGTSVEYKEARRESKARDLILPGNITAVQETTIYARANGYVARWLVDIGDEVKEGQLLAELATPEVDQQLAQAKDQLNTAQANFELARVTAQRWAELYAKKVVSHQEFDQYQSNYQASAATMSAAQANVRVLTETQGFKQVTAPFAGRITARKVDVGSLVSAGSGTAGTALYTLAMTDPLDIYVSVPQTNVPSIHDGLDVDLLVPEYPSRKFTAKVVRTAGALDPTSRTMLTEVEIPNKDGALYAGMYAQVKFSLPNPDGPLVIPANAFAFRVEGAQVATLTNDNKIHWQSLKMGRDFGTEMEVASGLEAGAKVVLNPTDDLKEGLQVQAKPADEKKPAQPAAGGQ